MKVYTISAPQLVNLQISAWKNVPSLEKVNIPMSSSIDPRNADDDMMTEFETDNVSIQENVLRMMLMGKGLCHVKSFTLSVHLS
ncbi:hypothetical protein EZV62_020896 [Acer yangbiense]|uniref:Uncharacterized protein n=1 Tax=Acer yangbiense TaxID=1000413 RepID=A0A5C7HF29_9ROSI|nr:hypothetical protein EZV62_020896 [Acer yangbiense]